MRLDNPVPDPPPVTATKSVGFFSMYFSAQAWPRLTMVSEPLTCIEFLSFAAKAEVVKEIVIRTNSHFFNIQTSFLEAQYLYYSS
jgi:hypothetical protein